MSTVTTSKDEATDAQAKMQRAKERLRTTGRHPKSMERVQPMSEMEKKMIETVAKTTTRTRAMNRRMAKSLDPESYIEFMKHNPAKTTTTKPTLGRPQGVVTRPEDIPPKKMSSPSLRSNVAMRPQAVTTVIDQKTNTERPMFCMPEKYKIKQPTVPKT